MIPCDLLGSPDTADQKLCGSSVKKINIAVAATFHDELVSSKGRFHVPLLHKCRCRDAKIYSPPQNRIVVHLAG